MAPLERHGSTLKQTGQITLAHVRQRKWDTMTITPTFNTRDASAEDVPALCRLLNEIIVIGGTTAFETPLTEADFQWQYLDAPAVVSCVVAVPVTESTEATAAPVAFQSITINPALPEQWGDVATFCQSGLQGTGIGTLLFEATCRRAIDHQLVTLNATIRSDNTGGLAYYSKQGFVDYAVKPNVPLKDGTPVDRLSKQYVLSAKTATPEESS